MNCPQCNTPIDEHQATQCLDAWVAETALKKSIAWPAHNEHPAIPGLELWNEQPRYSSDIAAAWQVVEGFKNFEPDRGGDSGFRVELHASGAFAAIGVYHELTIVGASAQTAPLAICRAALKAIEHERTIRNPA